jgi:hypothetical protein
MMIGIGIQCSSSGPDAAGVARCNTTIMAAMTCLNMIVMVIDGHGVHGVRRSN